MCWKRGFSLTSQPGSHIVSQVTGKSVRVVCACLYNALNRPLTRWSSFDGIGLQTRSAAYGVGVSVGNCIAVGLGVKGSSTPGYVGVSVGVSGLVGVSDGVPFGASGELNSALGFAAQQTDPNGLQFL